MPFDVAEAGKRLRSLGAGALCSNVRFTHTLIAQGERGQVFRSARPPVRLALMWDGSVSLATLNPSGTAARETLVLAAGARHLLRQDEFDSNGEFLSSAIRIV